MSPIDTVEQRGSHLLVTCDGRFAVVERRNGRIYDVRGRGRRDFDDTTEGIAAAVGDGWADEKDARRLFDDVTARGDALARRIW